MASTASCTALTAVLPKMARVGRALVGGGERGPVLLHLGAIESLDDPSLSELSAHLRLSQSTLSRRLAALRVENLVRLTPDPDDARRQHVALTDSGRHRLERCRAEVTERLTERLQRWSDDDVDLLVGLLERLSDSSTPVCPSTTEVVKGS